MPEQHELNQYIIQISKEFDLKLISTFHPKQFADGELYGTWGVDPYWKEIIFIDYDKDDLKKITTRSNWSRLKWK